MNEIAVLEQETKEHVFEPGKAIYIEAVSNGDFALITQPQTELGKGVSPHDYNPEFIVKVTDMGLEIPITPLKAPVYTAEQLSEGAINPPKTDNIVYVRAEVAPDGKFALIRHPKTSSPEGTSRHDFIPFFQMKSTGTHIELAVSIHNTPVLTADKQGRGG